MESSLDDGTVVLPGVGVKKENDVLSEKFINALANEEEQEICHQLNRRTEFQVLRTTYRLYE